MPAVMCKDNESCFFSFWTQLLLLISSFGLIQRNCILSTTPYKISLHCEHMYEAHSGISCTHYFDNQCQEKIKPLRTWGDPSYILKLSYRKFRFSCYQIKFNSNMTSNNTFEHIDSRFKGLARVHLAIQSWSCYHGKVHFHLSFV